MDIFHKFVTFAHVYVGLCMCVPVYACVCFLWMCGCSTEKEARQSEICVVRQTCGLRKLEMFRKGSEL